MNRFRLLCFTMLVMVFATLTSAFAQMPGSGDFVFGDPRPDAPELAAPGTYNIGVRTLEAVNPDQLDVFGNHRRKPRPALRPHPYPGSVLPHRHVPLGRGGNGL